VRLTQEGKHDLCLLGWTADNGDPDNLLYVLFDPENADVGSARNVAFYKNAELHGILAWAQESSDRAERERYYKKAQDLIARDAPWVPLAHAEVVVAARSVLQGLVVHPSSNIYFHKVVKK
jgi:peptide/nickel transport system substrate-binding protein